MKTIATNHQLILRCLSDGLSRTTQEIMNDSKLGYKTNTRISELMRKGFVKKVGMKEIPGGRALVVYKITTEGLLHVQKPRSRWTKTKSLFFIS